MMKKLALCFAALSIVYSTNCSLSSARNQWKEATPLFAFASPTGFAQLSEIPSDSSWSRVAASFDLPGLRALWKFLGRSASAQTQESFKPLSDLVRNAQALWDRSPYETAQNIDFEAQPNQAPRCFGAALEFNQNPVPAGKLGMLSENEPPVSGSQACAAAQMNYLVSLAESANASIRTMQVLSATARDNGNRLNHAGSSVDVTRVMPALGKKATVTKALVTLRVENKQKTYDTQIELQQEGQRGTISNQHTPLNSENTVFKGVLTSVLPYNKNDAVRYRGMKMTYESDGKTLTYLLEMASNREEKSENFFQDSRMNFTSPAFGEEGYRFLAKFDTITNEGSMKVAWMDDSRDSASRVFEVKVGKVDGHLLGGFAYFGFGEKLASLDSSKTTWITKFFSGWPNSPAIEGKCQAQVFSQTQVGGPFLSTGFHGPFVPTSDGTGSGVISGNHDFNGVTTVHKLDFVAPGAFGTVDISLPTI